MPLGFTATISALPRVNVTQVGWMNGTPQKPLRSGKKECGCFPLGKTPLVYSNVRGSRSHWQQINKRSCTIAPDPKCGKGILLIIMWQLYLMV